MSTEKKALVVVDYQIDFVDGTLGFPKAVGLESVICEKIAQCKSEGYTILFTLDTHEENYLQTNEGKHLPVEHCRTGTQGHQLYGKVADAMDADAVCFHKPVFGSMELAAYLKEHGYTHIELVGLVSNICVLTNAVLIKTAIPEAQIVVDSKATASFDDAMHEKAMDILEGIHITVINR